MNEMTDIPQDVPKLSISSSGLADLMDAVVEKGVPFRFRASGRSMFPAIRDGDTITISPLEPGEPRVGQVAACRLPDNGRLVVHRVVRRRKGQALIKGDRVANADGWVPFADLLGAVTAVERKGRRCLWPWRGYGGRLAFLVLGKLYSKRLLRALLRRSKKMLKAQEETNAAH